MTFREHFETASATIGGMTYAILKGLAGDIGKVAIAAAVSTIVGWVAKKVLDKLSSWLKARLNKK